MTWPVAESRLAEVARLYRAKWPVSDIAARLRISPNTVKVYAMLARKAGMDVPRAIATGGPDRRFDWMAAVRLRQQKLTMRAIADQLGVTERAVRKALHALAADGVDVGPLGRWPKAAAPAPEPKRATGAPLPMGGWGGISGYRV